MARIHSDSWGYEDTSGDYIAQSLAVDQFVEQQDIDCDCGGQ